MMSFSSPRRGKNQGSPSSARRPRRQARRPLVEVMEDRVVLTAAVSPHETTVTQLYQDLLHRLPDAGGLGYWAGRLDQGADAQAVAAAITHSTEFHRLQVDGVYQRLLNRAADEGGRAFFASALDHGQTVPQIESAIASSPEYVRTRGPGGFLDALFNDTAPLNSGADGVGALEASLAGAAHQALGAGAGGSGSGAAPLGNGPQAVTLKNGQPAVFQAFGPERLVDTRNTVAGQYGGPAFSAGQTRTINVAPYNLADPSIPSVAIGDQPPTSNLPNKVVAVSVILFIVGAPQAEYVTAYATGTNPAPIGTASVFADHAGQIIAASAIVPVNSAGNIDVYSSGGGNLIIDINGYYLNQLDGTDQLALTGNVPSGNVLSASNASTSVNASGVGGVISSTSAGAFSSGVVGLNNGSGSQSVGVWGRAKVGVFGDTFVNGAFTSGVGVEGLANGVTFITPGVNGIGVAGGANTGGTGVYGSSTGSGSFGGDFTGETGVRGVTSATATVFGVSGQVTNSGAAAGSAGVRGSNASTAGTVYGVLGQVTDSAAAAGSAAVRGTNASTATSVYGVNGTLTDSGAGDNSAGVRGANPTTHNGFGVLGVLTSTTPGNNSAGVRGINNGTDGFSVGVWGSQAGAGYGVYGSAGSGGYGVTGQASGSGSFGVFSDGNSGGTGTKSFLDPNPNDASTEIRYISLEGNEAGTYFRGTGHFTNGVATLDVPEDFRLVTDPTGLSIQVTPIGRGADPAVQSIDLNHIVVTGTQDVDFFYTVNGVRKGYAGYNPIEAVHVFVPRSATDTLPNYLNDVQKQSLIANGTYNADGTVNLTTAHRMGWDVLWAENGAHGTTATTDG